jgi:general secretion pathway protein K
MRIGIPNNRSGIALIIVLLVIVVLGILAGGFAYSMKVETTLARHATFSTDLDWAGRTGVEVAKWVLSQSMTAPQGPIGSFKREWGDLGATNDILAAVDLKNYQMGDALLSIDIKDLDRKFNINVADEIILRQAMTLIGVDAAASSTIIGSILDWRDPDSNTHLSGAESDYYEGLDPPYFAKDGPIDDLTELLLVRGVTPAMYWGSGGGGVPTVSNRQGSGLKRSVFDEPTYAVGLVDLFTPISSRLVNMNTASATVLQIFPDIDENLAQAIIARRAGPDGQDGTDDDMPFRSPAEIGTIAGMSPVAVQALGRYFTTRSLCFEVHISVDMRGTKREYVAILRRNGPKDIQTLNLHWK